MRLCKDLGLTVEEGLEKISILEFKLWVAYYTLEYKEHKQQVEKNGRRKHNR